MALRVLCGAATLCCMPHQTKLPALYLRHRTKPVGEGQLRGGCWVQSFPGLPHHCGVGRKPTSPAQRQEMGATWAAAEPHPHLALALKAERLGLGSLAACHGTGGPVWCLLFAGEEHGCPSVMEGSSLFGSATSVLWCPKWEAASGAPGLSTSFCQESALHPSLGTCPGLGCKCPTHVWLE